MINSIDEYLNQLKTEMKKCDIATRQDALSDAEDHLTSALSEALASAPDTGESEALQKIIEEYGSPIETAESYMDFEKRFNPSQASLHKTNGRNTFARRFFEIFGDSQAWGGVLYSLLALATGIIYFTWAVTGIAISASMMILIIGIPVAVAFFLSFHGLAFLEGRIIEGLLGVRMPSRRRFFDSSMTWGQKVKHLLLGADSWLYILYFIIMLPLGIIYFTITVTLFSISLAFIATPILGLIFGTEWIDIGTVVYALPYWTLPVVAVLGVFLLKGTLHLLKNIGKLHGRIAKTILLAREK